MVFKKRFITFIALASSLSCIYSQKQSIKYIDVIYFKDGTKVEGTIVYKVPKVNVSISRHNHVYGTDSVYTYPLNLVDRIVKEPENKSLLNSKEEPQTSTAAAISSNSSNNPAIQDLIKDRPFEMGLMQHKDKMQFQVTQKPQKTFINEPTFNISTIDTPGEMGIVDPSDPEGLYRKLREKGIKTRFIASGLRSITDYQYTHGIGAVKNNRFDFATSIGFQFNPYVYTGLGVSYGLTLNKKESSLPIFLNTKINIMDKQVSPYFNLKAGYSVMDAKGIYVNPGIGISFFGPKGIGAMNLELGYSYQIANYHTWSEATRTRTKINEDFHGISLKASFEINIITVK